MIWLLLYSSAPPPCWQYKLDRDTQKNWERETTCWREKREGVGGGAKSYDSRKPGPLKIIQYSLILQFYRSRIMVPHFYRMAMLEKHILLNLVCRRSFFCMENAPVAKVPFTSKAPIVFFFLHLHFLDGSSICIFFRIHAVRKRWQVGLNCSLSNDQVRSNY